MEFEYYSNEQYGLIRARIESEPFSYPEILTDGNWTKASEYVMDAIIGMGEDSYSVGGMAQKITAEEARVIALNSGVKL